ncbi:MAG: methyltransferase domain-containing protein [Lentimicrobium sp.]|nr:methyltransferase domain-containing protein [Lentimicrobium sp.]
MKHAKDTFRYLSSFASEQVISSYESKFGPEIEVCLINGRYQINAGSVNYSYGPLHDAFRRYFNLDPPVPGVDKPVLILGFGGGSIATILRRERELPNPITGVELDEMMLRAGSEHFGIDKIANLSIIQGDAFEYIKQCREKFSLIITDIYIDDIIPAVFEQREFLTEARRCLLPGGKLVFNKLLDDVNKDSALRALEAIFSDLFPESRTFLIPVNKKMPNYMITGSLT